MELFKVVDINEANDIVMEHFKMDAVSEKVSLLNSLGRVIYWDIVSRENIPGFRRSSVDGYAIKAKDSAGASETMPAMFELIEEVKMGHPVNAELKFPGECVYVPTGGMVPMGADAVVMIEYSEKLDDKTILINHSAHPGENLVEEDEDISLGEVVIRKGTVLRPYEIGVLSSLGLLEVEVCRKIKCGIISTGDEIIDPCHTPSQGQVRDINTYLLSSLAEEAGAEPVIYGVFNDHFEELKAAITTAVKECDMVLVSGGSSVGKKDQTFEAIECLEKAQILVHGIAVKPGKPTIIGKAEDKIIFGLPGHPLACAVVFKIIVERHINRLYSVNSIEYPVECSFAVNYHKARGREEFLPVSLEIKDNKLTAIPVLSKSGVISAFSKAYGYIRIGKNLEGIVQGDKVSVFKL
jgi:molybdopterin molybdotransferase